MRTAAFYETTDAERTKNVPACKFVNNQGGRGGTRGQGTLRSVNGDVIYLLRFFLTMPSRDTPASSRTEASMAALVFSVPNLAERSVTWACRTYP